MGRIISILFLSIVTYTVLKRLFRVGPTAPPSTSNNEAEKMCKCNYCNTHAPQSLGVIDGDGRYFCSTEHQKLFVTGTH